MVTTQLKRRNSDLPRMESVARLGSIPLVETSVKTVEGVYDRIKTSNRLFNWYFETAESTVLAAIDSLLPAVKLFEGPLRRIDNVMCKSLDLVEQRIPSVYLPPEMMYWNTKEYVSDMIMGSVLKPADSMKHIGSVVLDSRVTNFAADTIDGAFSVADKYVDRYLTLAECSDSDVTDGDNSENKDDKGKYDNQDLEETSTMKAIHHGQRFSRKFKRRLTQRTIAEARALRRQSREAIHVVKYAAELIASDPKSAMEKARELWEYLSGDEPENQERPETLEQLIVLLTRESARRIVHIINYGIVVSQHLPRSVVSSSRDFLHHITFLAESLLKTSSIDTAKEKTAEEIALAKERMIFLYDAIQTYLTNTLERLAIFLSGRLEAEKITANPRHRIQRSANNNSLQNNINGVY